MMVSKTQDTDGSAASEDNVDEFLGVKRKPKWRRWMKYWLPALIVLALILFFWMSGADSDEQLYITEEVTEDSLNLTVTATGNLRPTNQVQVGSEVSGRIDAVRVDVNDQVVRGQVLAVINTDVIDDEIAVARANLRSAQASLAQARASLQLSHSQLHRLQDVYERSGGKVPSKTELDQARATMQRDQAAVASAKATIAAQSAQLSSAQTNRGRAVIRSPVSGVVLAREVEPGQTVAASFNTPTLFVIAENLSQMQLRVDVDEADVGQVEAGQKAKFTVDAYPGRQFPAAVIRVDQASTNTVQDADNSGSQLSGGAVVNYEARLAVSNNHGLLRPGMTATSTIETRSTGKGLLVPSSALRFDPKVSADEAEGGVLSPEIGLKKQEQRAVIGVGSKQSVHVLKEDGTFEVIKVVTGFSDGRTTFVTSKALKPGMKVIVGEASESP